MMPKGTPSTSATTARLVPAASMTVPAWRRVKPSERNTARSRRRSVAVMKSACVIAAAPRNAKNNARDDGKARDLLEVAYRPGRVRQALVVHAVRESLVQRAEERVVVSALLSADETLDEGVRREGGQRARRHHGLGVERRGLGRGGEGRADDLQ